MSEMGKATYMLLAAQMEPRLFDLDFQLLADAVLTLIAVISLFFFLSYFLFNPARDFMNRRREKIKSELDEAKKSQEEAEALKAQYEDKLKNIDKEAESILSEARKKALDNEASIVAKAKQEAHSIVERAGIEAEQEKLRVKDDVKKEMINVASAVAKKAVGNSMDVNVQERLVDETLKEIGEGTWLS